MERWAYLPQNKDFFSIFSVNFPLPIILTLMSNYIHENSTKRVMPHLNGVGATSACLREAASAKAGRPK